MLKISRVEAYQGMNEIDFNVMDDELYTCFNSDQRKDKEQTQQFFLLDETTIILEIYWDDEKVHTVSFENKAELTESGKEKLSKEKLKGECNMENKNYYELDKALCYAESATEDIESAKLFLGDLMSDLENIGIGDSYVNQAVIKLKGIQSILNRGSDELTKHLNKALEVSEQLNGFETEKKA